MSRRRCGTGVPIERFAVYLRLIGQAKGAGLTSGEAARAIYPDTYPDAGRETT